MEALYAQRFGPRMLEFTLTWRLGAVQRSRVEALRHGDLAQADAFAIEAKPRRIEELSKQEQEAAQAYGDSGVGDAIRQTFEKKKSALSGDVEAILPTPGCPTAAYVHDERIHNVPLGKYGSFEGVSRRGAAAFQFADHDATPAPVHPTHLVPLKRSRLFAATPNQKSDDRRIVTGREVDRDVKDPFLPSLLVGELEPEEVRKHHHGMLPSLTRARLAKHVGCELICGNADDAHDRRLNHQHTAAPREPVAPPAIDDRLDSCGEQNRNEQEEQDLPDSPQHIAPKSQSEDDHAERGPPRQAGSGSSPQLEYVGLRSSVSCSLLTRALPRGGADRQCFREARSVAESRSRLEV